MPKTLVIAEKPSVAAVFAKDLGSVFGKFEKKDNYYENDRYVIAWAVGHLVELCLPNELDKQRGKWSFANLPVIPDHFELKIREKGDSLFKTIKRLAKRADVGEIVNACDAGREGELIFHYIMQLAGNKKPTRRLWLQSYTSASIVDGFKNLLPESAKVDLARAAICRSESDWLVGINATRAMTAFNSKGGGFQLTPVGRVQTPTLAILADREEAIRAFQSRPYWEVFADFGVSAGSYRGRWFDEKFKKNDDEHARAERIWDRAEADRIAAKCQGRPGIVTEEKKPTTQIAPQLYDLATMQREANSRFGLSATRTLQVLQSLYEKRKVLTYPRTDSRYLPEDYIPTVKDTMSKLDDSELLRHAEKAMDAGWIRLNRRIFDKNKVSDHHAIIPTGVSANNLDDLEAKIYDMVARRFVAAFYPAAQFEVTTRITRVESEPFKTEGKILVEPGWMAVYGKSAVGKNEQNVCAVKAGETAETDAVEVKDCETKPPARFTEGTLVTAMEGAGKLIEDDSLREAMAERGLGTPATRGEIMKGLHADGYIITQGKDLIVTSKGLSLITLLRALGVQALTSPEMTGEWEHKLKRMEKGDMPRPQFMEEIRELTSDIVDKAKSFEGDTVQGNFQPLDVPCPKCGHVGFSESYKAFECGAKCGAIVWKTMAGRQLEREEVEALLRHGRVGPLEGFRSKLGRPFAAVVKLDDEFKQTFDFGDTSDHTPLDFSNLPVLGPCPVCSAGTIHDTGTSWQCSNAKGCKFRMGKTLCQREVPREQVIKLLEAGKTDLISRFISKKGKPFAAFLKRDGAKVVFEFEERKPAAKKAPGKPAR